MASRRTNRPSISVDEITEFFDGIGGKPKLTYHHTKTNRWYEDAEGNYISRRKAMDMYIAENDARFRGASKYADFYRSERKTNRAFRAKDGYMTKIFKPKDFPDGGIMTAVEKYAKSLAKKYGKSKLLMIGAYGVLSEIYEFQGSATTKSRIFATRLHDASSYKLAIDTFINKYYVDMEIVEYIFIKWR